MTLCVKNAKRAVIFDSLSQQNVMKNCHPKE